MVEVKWFKRIIFLFDMMIMHLEVCCDGKNLAAGIIRGSPEEGNKEEENHNRKTDDIAENDNRESQETDQSSDFRKSNPRIDQLGSFENSESIESECNFGTFCTGYEISRTRYVFGDKENLIVEETGSYLKVPRYGKCVGILIRKFDIEGVRSSERFEMSWKRPYYYEKNRKSAKKRRKPHYVPEIIRPGGVQQSGSPPFWSSSSPVSDNILFPMNDWTRYINDYKAATSIRFYDYQNLKNEVLAKDIRLEDSSVFTETSQTVHRIFTENDSKCNKKNSHLHETFSCEQNSKTELKKNRIARSASIINNSIPETSKSLESLKRDLSFDSDVFASVDSGCCTISPWIADEEQFNDRSCNISEDACTNTAISDTNSDFNLSAIIYYNLNTRNVLNAESEEETLSSLTAISPENRTVSSIEDGFNSQTKENLTESSFIDEIESDCDFFTLSRDGERSISGGESFRMSEDSVHADLRGFNDSTEHENQRNSLRNRFFELKRVFASESSSDSGLAKSVKITGGRLHSCSPEIKRRCDKASLEMINLPADFDSRKKRKRSCDSVADCDFAHHSRKKRKILSDSVADCDFAQNSLILKNSSHTDALEEIRYKVNLVNQNIFNEIPKGFQDQGTKAFVSSDLFCRTLESSRAFLRLRNFSANFLMVSAMSEEFLGGHGNYHVSRMSKASSKFAFYFFFHAERFADSDFQYGSRSKLPKSVHYPFRSRSFGPKSRNSIRSLKLYCGNDKNSRYTPQEASAVVSERACASAIEQFGYTPQEASAVVSERACASAIEQFGYKPQEASAVVSGEITSNFMIDRFIRDLQLPQILDDIHDDIILNYGKTDFYPASESAGCEARANFHFSTGKSVYPGESYQMIHAVTDTALLHHPDNSNECLSSNSVDYSGYWSPINRPRAFPIRFKAETQKISEFSASLDGSEAERKISPANAFNFSEDLENQHFFVNKKRHFPMPEDGFGCFMVDLGIKDALGLRISSGSGFSEVLMSFLFSDCSCLLLSVAKPCEDTLNLGYSVDYDDKSTCLLLSVAKPCEDTLNLGYSADYDDPSTSAKSNSECENHRYSLRYIPDSNSLKMNQAVKPNDFVSELSDEILPDSQLNSLPKNLCEQKIRPGLRKNQPVDIHNSSIDKSTANLPNTISYQIPSVKSGIFGETPNIHSHADNSDLYFSDYTNSFASLPNGIDEEFQISMFSDESEDSQDVSFEVKIFIIRGLFILISLCFLVIGLFCIIDFISTIF